MVVTVHGEEHLVVVVDESIPQTLPETGGQGRAGWGNIDDLVGGDDRRYGLVGVEHGLSPVKVVAVGSPGYVDGHHRHTGDGELVPVRQTAGSHFAKAWGLGLSLIHI